MVDASHEARTRLAAGLLAGAASAFLAARLAELAPFEPYSLAAGGVLGVALLAVWKRLGPRLGPRHLLDAALPLLALTLVVFSVFDPLGLPAGVRLLADPLLGAAASLAGWSLAKLPGSRSRSLLLGLAAGLAAGLGAVLAGRVSLVLAASALAVLIAWVAVRDVPDPSRPGDDPLDPFVPWAIQGARRGWPGGLRALARAPATIGYLALSWSVFLAWGEETPDGFGLNQTRFEAFLYEIPELSRAPVEAAGSLVTAPFLNHDGIQLAYVTALLLLFGLVFEVREGTLRAATVFLVSGLAGAIVAGLLLHGLIDLFPRVPLLERAWTRTWSGGSAGAFGLMGALSARAQRPAPLLGFFVFWELNVGWWYLESYTPAFHLTALAVGFAWTRWRQDPAG